MFSKYNQTLMFFLSWSAFAFGQQEPANVCHIVLVSSVLPLRISLLRGASATKVVAFLCVRKSREVYEIS